MNKLSSWLKAARLRALPLASACILTGSALALGAGSFRGSIFLLALGTALLLQILSNLANDLGDFDKGVDNADRVGPARALQSGLLTRKEIIAGIWVISLFSLLVGALLIYRTSGPGKSATTVLFAVLGFSAIAAALKYTLGKKPYGYSGFGDLFVFFFFGPVGVAGTCYLHTGAFDATTLLPSAAVGWLSVGVLNINNLRDHDSDLRSGKRTLPVRMGPKGALHYQMGLVMGALVVSVAYLAVHDRLFTLPSALPLVAFLPLTKITVDLSRKSNPSEIDPFLRKHAMLTLLYAVLFAIGINF
ncbi:MAG: 1,4-dihydroxy-2-naphthoate octaprenyltransferase [Candidatus Latescibacterota bacterium]